MFFKNYASFLIFFKKDVLHAFGEKKSEKFQIGRNTGKFFKYFLKFQKLAIEVPRFQALG